MDKIVSICRNNDFRRIYQRGKSYVSPLVVAYVQKNRTKNVRVGITTSKKIGNAVLRSRSRRVIREAYRSLAPRVRTGYDLVLVARGKTPYAKSTDVGRCLERQLTEAGILEQPGDTDCMEKRRENAGGTEREMPGDTDRMKERRENVGGTERKTVGDADCV